MLEITASDNHDMFFEESYNFKSGMGSAEANTARQTHTSEYQSVMLYF